MCSTTRPVAQAALLAPLVPNGGPAAWIRVLAYSLIGMATIGVHYVFGALYVALLEDEHMVQPFPGAFALLGGLCVAVMTNAAPLAAYSSSMYGYRRTALAGALISGSGLALSACVSSAWVLFPTFFIIGVGQSLSLFSAIVLMPLWFDSRLNRVNALANSFAACTSLFLGPPAHTTLAAVGWRPVLLCLAIVTTLILATAATLLTPPACAARSHAAGGAEKVRWASLLRCGVVRWLAVCVALYGLGGWLAIVHIVRLGLERGLATEQASRLLLFVGLGNCTLRLPCGWAADALGKLRTHASITLVLAALNGLCALPCEISGAFPFLATYAYLVGGLIGGCNSLNNGLAIGLLPLPQARVAVTMLMCPFGIGMMLGPLIAGALRDASGSYQTPLLYGATCLALSSAGVGLGKECFRHQLEQASAPPDGPRRAAAAAKATARRQRRRRAGPSLATVPEL